MQSTNLPIQQPDTAKLVELRFFAGFTNVEAAKILNVSPRHADSLWAFAKAWLHERLFGENASELACSASVSKKTLRFCAQN